MSTLSTTRNYLDGADLTQAELDAAFDSIETWGNGNIGTANIGTSGVDTTNIAASAVTAAKIASDAVTTAKILDSNVTTAKINDLAITTGKINTAAVTQAKKAVRVVKTDGTDPGAGGLCITGTSGNYTSTSGTYTTVTNLSGTLTTLGNPVYIQLQPDVVSDLNSAAVGNGSGLSQFAFFRDSTELGSFKASSETIRSVGGISFMDTPSAGTYVYTLQHKRSSGTTAVSYCVMTIYEL